MLFSSTDCSEAASVVIILLPRTGRQAQCAPKGWTIWMLTVSWGSACSFSFRIRVFLPMYYTFQFLHLAVDLLSCDSCALTGFLTFHRHCFAGMNGDTKRWDTFYGFAHGGLWLREPLHTYLISFNCEIWKS